MVRQLGSTHVSRKVVLQGFVTNIERLLTSLKSVLDIGILIIKLIKTYHILREPSIRDRAISEPVGDLDGYLEFGPIYIHSPRTR